MSVRLEVDEWLANLPDGVDAVNVAMARGLASAFDVEPSAAVAKELRAVRALLEAQAATTDEQSGVGAAIRGG